MRYSGCAPWSLGNDHCHGPIACFHSVAPTARAHWILGWATTNCHKSHCSPPTYVCPKRDLRHRGLQRSEHRALLCGEIAVSEHSARDRGHDWNDASLSAAMPSSPIACQRIASGFAQSLTCSSAKRKPLNLFDDLSFALSYELSASSYELAVCCPSPALSIPPLSASADTSCTLSIKGKLLHQGLRRSPQCQS